MPYYGALGDCPRGDYYAGDYYQGDSFLKKLGKGITKVVGSVVPGPIGLLANVANKALTSQPPMARPPVGPTIPLPGGGRIDPFALLPGGAPLIRDGCCPRGYHWDKATGTKCVKNRHMNPLNPRAVNRAERRIRSGLKITKRLYTIVHGKAPSTVRMKGGRGKR